MRHAFLWLSMFRSRAMAIPKLTYLNLKGLGEAIRLTLHVGHVDFEDIRLSYAEVKQLEDAGKRLWKLFCDRRCSVRPPFGCF